MAKMQLQALAALSDNYIWLLHNGKQALIVDPGEAAPVQAALAEQGLELTHILITHQHQDHIGALADLLRLHGAGVQVWAARHPLIQAQTRAAEAAGNTVTVLDGGEGFSALGLDWQVLAAPGHTLSHILFYCAAVPQAAGTAPLLFCGDTLFSAGCGRLFEGSPAQMLQTLGHINTLPGATQICCTHEYTLTNLRFALSLQPDNALLLDYQGHCQQLRAQELPTLPSTLALERRLNPFLQALDPIWAAAMALHFTDLAADSLSVFTRLRQLRNGFI